MSAQNLLKVGQMCVVGKRKEATSGAGNLYSPCLSCLALEGPTPALLLGALTPGSKNLCLRKKKKKGKKDILICKVYFFCTN